MRAKAKEAIAEGKITETEELDDAEEKLEAAKAKLKELRLFPVQETAVDH